MCKRHPHADVIIAWAEGKLIQIKQPSGEWEDVKSKSPMFDPKWEYRIKPEPVEVITCNGVVITPMKEKPMNGDDYYVVTPQRPELYCREVWRNDSDDQRFFNRGVVHRTAKSAREHALAMLNTKKELQDV